MRFSLSTQLPLSPSSEANSWPKKWVRQSQKLLFDEPSISGKQLHSRGRDAPQPAGCVRYLFLWFSGCPTAPCKAIEDLTGHAS